MRSPGISPSSRRLLAPFAVVAIVTAARGQCATQWLPGPALTGTDYTVYAATDWDPDGAGPRAPVIVLGGWFRAAGDVVTSSIVAFDPATSAWSTFGSGVSTGEGDRVHALAVMPNGDLVAAGRFTSAGSVSAMDIARWNGSAWASLGTGFDNDVLSLVVLPNGDLVAGGHFTTAGGVAANGVARWNGSAWAPLGAGLNNAALALAVLPNGHLVAGGSFTTAGGAAASNIASWDGASWSPLGSGIGGPPWPFPTVNTLTVLANGDLVAAGSFDSAGGVPAANAARWDGTAWSSLGPGIGWVVNHVCTFNGTDVIAVGQTSVQRWNGTAWSSLGSQSGAAEVVAQLANGDVLVGGYVQQLGSTAVHNVGVWNGTAWSRFGAGDNPWFVRCATGAANGDVVAGAVYASGGAMVERVVRRNGAVWQQLGGDFTGSVSCIATAANGDVVVGGSFSAIGTTPAQSFARWNGTVWAPLGTGIDFSVNALLPLPNGDIIAGGNFTVIGGVAANGVARWNGTAWSPLGAGLPGAVHSLTLGGDGGIVAGGENLGASKVARWNGTTWLPLGTMPGWGIVHALATRANGDIVAGGTFSTGIGLGLAPIARWTGNAWVPLATSGPGVDGIAALPDGDVVAVGHFAAIGGASCHGIARWTGSGWAPLATSGALYPRMVATMANGDLVVTGVDHLNGVVSAAFAQLTTTCPASASPSGSGCSGNVLAATNLPWTGSTYRSRASGLPATSIAVHVLGVSTVSVPLPLLLPQGVAGCTLLASPDAAGTLLPAGGSVTTELPIPNTSSLSGAIVHEQVVALGIGAAGAIATFTGTNRLTLTVGSF